MNCAEVEKHLSEYLDNEAASDLCQQIAEHLAECASCQQKLAEMAALSRSLAALEEDLPADFTSRFAEQLAAPNQESAKVVPLYKRAWFKIASIAACLLLCLGTVGVLADRGGSGYDKAYEEAQQLTDTHQSAENTFDETIVADEASNDRELYGGEDLLGTQNANAEDKSTDIATDDANNSPNNANDRAVAPGSTPDSADEAGFSIIPLVIAIAVIIFIICIVLLHRNKKSKI